MEGVEGGQGECGRRVLGCPQGLEFRERERPEILVIKILVAGAKTEDIVDLVLYSRSYSSVVTSEDVDCNPRKKLKLYHTEH